MPGFSGVARAQMDSREGIALQNQLYQLRQEVQNLRGEVGRGGGGSGGGDIAAQLLSRVQSMEEQVRQLRGRIDEAQNRQRRQYDEMAKRVDDLTFQLNLQTPSRNGSAVPAAPELPRPAAEPARAEPPRTEPPRTEPPRTEAPRTEAPRVEPPRPEPPRPEPPRVRNEPPAQPEPPRIVVPTPPFVLSPPAPGRPPSFTFNQAPEPMREIPPPRPEARPEPPRAEPPPVATRPEPPPRTPARPPVVTPPPPAADVTATPIPPGGKRTPEMALQEGQAALGRRDYQTAERAAREVMSNRTSPRAYDGQFLLAQTLAGAKQNAQAAIAFDDAYNRSRKGRHAQDALLGLAGALTAINEKRAACDTLSRLRTEFPQVRADLKDTITRTNDRAGCGR